MTPYSNRENSPCLHVRDSQIGSCCETMSMVSYNSVRFGRSVESELSVVLTVHGGTSILRKRVVCNVLFGCGLGECISASFGMSAKVYAYTSWAAGLRWPWPWTDMTCLDVLRAPPPSPRRVSCAIIERLIAAEHVPVLQNGHPDVFGGSSNPTVSPKVLSGCQGHFEFWPQSQLQGDRHICV